MKFPRRSVISALMVLAIASTSPASAAEPSMSSVVSDFVEASIRLQSIDMEGKPEAYSVASKDRSATLTALTFHRPVDLDELANKLAALVEFSEEGERFALRIVVEDALALRSGAK